MKKLSILSVMLLVVAFLFPAAVAAQQYTADKGKTVVKWEGSKVVGGSHYGTISLKSGSINLEKGLPVSGEIVVDMTTIVDTDLEGGMKERLEGHLKSDDFFGVEKFPVATLVVKGAKANDDGTVTVTGHLTIKQVNLWVANKICNKEVCRITVNFIWGI